MRISDRLHRLLLFTPNSKSLSLSGLPAQLPIDSMKESKIVNETHMLKEFRMALDQLVEADEFSGTVLVAKDETILFEQAYGMAHQSEQIPILVNRRCCSLSSSHALASILLHALSLFLERVLDKPWRVRYILIIVMHALT